MPVEIANSALSIPTIVWSGGVAALISLIGVLISNRSGLERLREQLRHDAAQKHRDRVFDLRKDVYLELTAQISRANSHLGALAGKDAVDEDIAEPISAVMVGLSKLQLIGSREAAALAAELTALYGEALFNVTAAAAPLHDLKSDIKFSGQMFDEYFDQAKRANAEIIAHIETGAQDEARIAALQKCYEIYRDSFQKYSRERDEAWKKHNSLHKDFLRVVFGEVKKIAPVRIRLECAIRSEIGLDSDTSQLFARLNEDQVRAEKAIDEFLAKLELRP